MHRALKLLKRGLLLRCPNCGRATFSRGLLAVYERCRACGLRFEHDAGFFLGALIVNYLLTFTLVVIPAILLVTRGTIGLTPAIVLAACGCVVLPVILYWHAKSLWMAIFYLVVPDDLRAARREAASGPAVRVAVGPVSVEEQERADLEKALAELEGGRH